MSDNIEIILKEYEALRNEILDRSQRESTSLFWSLGLLVAVFGTDKFRTELIWAIPAAFTFFGYLWFESASAIQTIGNYIRTEIEDKLSLSLGAEGFRLKWENYLHSMSSKKRGALISFTFFHVLYFNLVIIGSIIGQYYWFHDHFNDPHIANRINVFRILLISNHCISVTFLIYSLIKLRNRNNLNK